MLYIENPVPNDIVRRRKPQYIILLDGVLSLSLPNVYQKQPGTVAVPGLFALGMPGVSTRCLPTSLFAALLCHLELHVGGNPSFFMACKGRHTPLGFKIQKEEIQMRNLKRALSLALAAIMLVGMMVVSASAASYNDLTDKDQIVNKDAVSMLVTLGVIEGKPDGSYAPTEGVDRAQMAKMISVIMNQGVDNGALYENSPSGLTDISSHWAKGHINYCYTTGIIAGRGNGKFDPDAGVTGSEAAKMLLVAAGYDPAIEGLTGTDWEINTNALASKLGIFRNFKGSVAEPLSRDNAALLIYNALDVEMIESYMKAYTYAENADGTYDIGDDVENAGTAKLLKNGTVDSSLKGYIALSGKANVWDVTDVDTAEDKTALGTFPYNTKVNAVIVEDDNAIRTAWIWEVEEGDNDIDDNNPIATEVTKIDADNFKIYLNAFVGADNRVAVITRAMEKAGYTDVTFASAANNEYTVTAQVKSSSGISTSLTFTTVTRWFSDSAIGAENVDNYNNAADLPDNSALIGDGSDLATITGGSVGTDITAGDNMMFTYTTKGTGNVVLTISDRSGVVYRETHGTAGSPSASVAAGQHYFYISLDNGSLNTSSTSNKVDTANDKCTFAGKLADGNYVWSVTENGTTVASGSFTLDRGV